MPREKARKNKSVTASSRCSTKYCKITKIVKFTGKHLRCAPFY